MTFTDAERKALQGNGIYADSFPKIECAVLDFAIVTGPRQSLPAWLARILTFVSGTEIPSDDHRLKVAETFERMAQEEWEDDKAWFIRNPASYRQQNKGCPNGPVQHPWGDEEMALCRKWIAASDYQIWRVYEACRLAGEEELKESLLAIATCWGDWADSFDSRLQKAFADAVNGAEL